MVPCQAAPAFLEVRQGALRIARRESQLAACLDVVVPGEGRAPALVAARELEGGLGTRRVADPQRAQPPALALGRHRRRLQPDGDVG